MDFRSVSFFISVKKDKLKEKLVLWDKCTALTSSLLFPFSLPLSLFLFLSWFSSQVSIPEKKYIYMRLENKKKWDVEILKR